MEVRMKFCQIKDEICQIKDEIREALFQLTKKKMYDSLAAWLCQRAEKGTVVVTVYLGLDCFAEADGC